MKATRSIDETANKYGDLVVERRLPAKHGKAQWHCYCNACGANKAISGLALRNGTATHCGCKTKRDFPTLLSLGKRLSALEDLVAALQGTDKPGLLDFPAFKVKQPPAPKPTQAPQASQTPQADPNHFLAAMEDILAVPFDQRDIAAMQEEFKRLSNLEADRLNVIKNQYAYWEGQPDIMVQHQRFLAAHIKFKKFHIHPKDL